MRFSLCGRPQRFERTAIGNNEEELVAVSRSQQPQKLFGDYSVPQVEEFRSLRLGRSSCSEDDI